MMLAQCAVIAHAQLPSTLPDAIARCSAIHSEAQRLTCYDEIARAAAVGQTGLTARSSSPPPRGGSAAIEDANTFGLRQAPPALPEAPSQLVAKIKRIDTDARGSIYVALDNDQTWLLNETDALLTKGDAVVIRRAALGSFIMTTPTRRVYRVRRTS